MTKNELLSVAKDLGIVGRHEMTKEALQAAVDAHNANANAAIAQMEVAAEQSVSVERVKNVTRRLPSLRKRDNTGRIIRAGQNLSGNVPFSYKYYFLKPELAVEAKWTEAYKLAFNAAPTQVKLILKSMAKYNVGIENADIGESIVNTAKERNLLTSKIDSDKLFAYYRRALEVLGVVHAKDYDEESVGETQVEDEGDEDEAEVA